MQIEENVEGVVLAITHFENNSNSSPGLLGYRFKNLQLCCTFDVIGSIWQNSSKFGQQ